MQKFFILWGSALVFLMSGCSTKHFSISEPKILTLKTPKIKYADVGYIRYEGDAVQVELFIAGVSIEKITIDDGVCVSAGCMSEEQFTREYLNANYPNDTMRRILQNSDIFGGMGKSETCGGVRFQTIRNDMVDITYRREEGEISFKDMRNKIMIKISDLQEGNVSALY
jgi:hypothetical protein